MSTAKRVQREALYLQDRDRLMHDRAWVVKYGPRVSA